MKEYTIWCEGYAATGESGTADLMATIEAESFDQAVEKMLRVREQTDWPDIRKYYACRDQYVETEERPKLIKVHSIWACRLFDNEVDARKSFG